jgi:hypothetical protein
MKREPLKVTLATTNYKNNLLMNGLKKVKIVHVIVLKCIHPFVNGIKNRVRIILVQIKMNLLIIL